MMLFIGVDSTTRLPAVLLPISCGKRAKGFNLQSQSHLRQESLGTQHLTVGTSARSLRVFNLPFLRARSFHPKSPRSKKPELVSAASCPGDAASLACWTVSSPVEGNDISNILHSHQPRCYSCVPYKSPLRTERGTGQATPCPCGSVAQPAPFERSRFHRRAGNDASHGGEDKKKIGLHGGVRSSDITRMWVA
jgi:hypothetical protein